QALDLIGAAPPGQVYVGDLSAIVAHVGKLVVQVVAHQLGQRQVQQQQKQRNEQQDPYWQGLASVHALSPLGVVEQWTDRCRAGSAGLTGTTGIGWPDPTLSFHVNHQPTERT